MNRQRDASPGPTAHSLDGQVRAAKIAIAARLRYIRQHHPEGPFTLAKLAERAGVSKRTLASAESSDGTNLTIETLVKVAHSLGIQRWAYFLDERVFGEVNAELETLKELRRGNVETVALRTSTVRGTASRVPGRTDLPHHGNRRIRKSRLRYAARTAGGG